MTKTNKTAKLSRRHFIVGSAAEVTPVAEIGPYKFTPGNMSRSLMDSYSTLVRQ